MSAVATVPGLIIRLLMRLPIRREGGRDDDSDRDADDSGPPQWQQWSSSESGKDKVQKPTEPVSIRIDRDLKQWGYDLWLNDMDDSVWNGDRRMTDVMRCEMRTCARDHGYAENRLLNALEDVSVTLAARRRRNPVQEYLESTLWDGQDHIAKLASFFTDNHAPVIYPDGSQRTVFEAFLLRWLVGAVAKIYGDRSAARANFVLTIVAEQGKGKSHLPAWLCPHVDLFVEKSINPDDKDDRLLRSTAMIWEIGELGATTKRADVEALKSFLTASTNNDRKSYGHFNIVKPCVASYMGTVNSDGAGFLVDTTGNRRFAVVEVTAIDWGYATQVNRDQLWAQAVALWRANPQGYRLTPEEIAVQRTNAEEHLVPDVLGDALARIYDFDLSQTEWRATSSEILDNLRKLAGISRGNDKHQGRELAAALKHHWGIIGKRSNGATVYTGLRLKQQGTDDIEVQQYMDARRNVKTILSNPDRLPTQRELTTALYKTGVGWGQAEKYIALMIGEGELTISKHNGREVMQWVTP
jgi:predicted P-loop ATPase